jgi:hypothetical protein
MTAIELAESPEPFDSLLTLSPSKSDSLRMYLSKGELRT